MAQPGDLERFKRTPLLSPEDIDRLYVEIVAHDTSKHSSAKRAEREEATDKASSPAKGGSCCQLTKEMQDGMAPWEKRF